ncbi:helix-turn-helix domain-containing protein [Burkholderia cepacia]|uniref:AraC family transcriptional regulator n=1 Tax=Burkholderia cepacia GG4 TaxID=1009846 RepID=A0A9W3K6U0_BURCE|nr:AraC family transcriptional regulator [Burkholderia cepacia]AFQ52199.1 AraC family transcriptional regulator [Burkholderia cepacia GG4]
MEVPMTLPEGWVQLAQPSPWRGLHVNHMVATSYESEFVTPAVIISYIRRAARCCEYREKNGRWAEMGIGAGTVCCLPFDYEGRTRWEGDAEAINLYVDFSWLRGCASADLRLFDQPIFGLNDKISQVLIGDIYKDNQLGAPSGLSYSESMVLALLHRLDAKSSQRPIVRVSEDSRIVSLVIDYIHDNFQESLSIENMARATGYEGSLYAFFRLIKRHTGKTPHQYILEVRLEKAKNRLIKGGATVTDVALSCGFNNIGHFATAFKRHWGVRPSEVLRSSLKSTP